VQIIRIRTGSRFLCMPKGFPVLIALPKFEPYAAVFLLQLVYLGVGVVAGVLELKDDGFETGDWEE
jgi:hypothetical protein